METINAISEAKTIDEVVSIINRCKHDQISEYFGGTDTRDAEAMAGQYAYSAALESGFVSDSAIEAHLDLLSEAGAVFEFQTALKNALNRKE